MNIILLLREMLKTKEKITIDFEKTKHGILVIISQNGIFKCKQLIKDFDTEEYIRLTLFDMFDYMGMTPKSVEKI